MCCTIEQAIVGGVDPNLKKDFVKCEVMFMHPQPNTTPNCNTNKKMEIQQDINTNFVPTHCFCHMLQSLIFTNRQIYNELAT
jgi:hypothetical protein